MLVKIFDSIYVGKVRMDAGCFFRGNYGTTLRYRTMVSRQWYLERRLASWQCKSFQNNAKRSERSYRKTEQGDGNAQPMMVNSEALVGSATATK